MEIGQLLKEGVRIKVTILHSGEEITGEYKVMDVFSFPAFHGTTVPYIALGSETKTVIIPLSSVASIEILPGPSD